MIPDDQSRSSRQRKIDAALSERRRLVRNAHDREVYGPTHRRRRRQYALRIERGEEVICPRCGLPIGADQHWDLGHDDFNPSLERPEHRACNRAAPNRLLHSREW